MVKRRVIISVIACVLIAVIAYSGYRLFNIEYNYATEASMHSQLMQYKPEMPISEANLPATPTREVNQGILDLQSKYPNANVVGWLTIPNTKIDYPFAQAQDNSAYLSLDLDHNWAQSGTIFMDYRNKSNFSDFNTIIFGHHMNSGSMFSSLQYFIDQDFFDKNKSGTIFLADRTYQIEIIAVAVIDPDDALIYDPTIATDAEKTAFLDHVKSVARHYRNVSISKNDHIVTLSTCNYEYQNAREVLIGRLVEI